MNRPAVLLVAGLVAAAACSCRQARSPSYDLVVANGRVMDPESGLDAVRHIGIRGGTIEAVSATPLAGSRVIDAAHSSSRLDSSTCTSTGSRRSRIA